eukprot:scaffold3586_cov164-Amphora_coffeaeformis.AAC.17
MTESSSPVLRELPLPDTTEVGFHPDTRDDNELSTASSFGSSSSCCLCPHALARKSQIYGRTIRRKKPKDSQNSNNSHIKYHDTTWLSWRTSLAPHCVAQIVSNHDGSILAAATDRGTVSLLRGSDGKVLATRQVSQTATQLCFVPTSFTNGQQQEAEEGDTLLIQTQVTEHDDDVMNCVVVSNIQGAKLNGRPESAAEAARQMKIRALPRGESGWKGIARVTALYRSSSVLLLVAVNHEGQLRLFDWNFEEGTLTMLAEKVHLQLSKDETEWAVDYRLGLMTQPVNDQIYIVFAAYAPGAAALAWLNPESKQCVCHVPLHVRSAQVGVFMPLPSFESTVAVAVAVKTETTTQLNVYQLLVEDTMGLTVLSKPHLVFSVPLSCALHEVSLATTLQDEVYGFAYQFERAGQPIVTETGDYDEADNLLMALGEEAVDPLADFHPSEVASARLRNMVTSEMPKQENIGICLQRLAKSAMTLNDTAIQTFAQACEMIPDRVLSERADRQIVVIDQVLRFVENVIDSVSSLESTVIKDVENSLRDRGRALRFVAAVPDGNVSDALLGIKSTQDLLGKILSRGDYALVQKLWDWEGGKALSVDVLLAEIVNIPPTVDPVLYLPLMKNILLPNLTIHHELLPILRAWTCCSADGMDEKQIGLPSAISLLEYFPLYSLNRPYKKVFVTSVKINIPLLQHSVRLSRDYNHGN